MKKKMLLTAMLLGLVFLVRIGAEDRKVVLVLDVSGSMNEGGKFKAVQSYIERDLFQNFLQSGDEFTLVLFGNEPRQAFTHRIQEDTDTNRLLDRIRSLEADDDYTDIGKALEYLFEHLSRQKAKQDVKVIFITDGKNTPPRDSPYWGKDLSVDNRFREIGRKISQNGWYIYVIGIGRETDAKAISSAVEGSVLRETDTTLEDVRIEEYLERVESLHSGGDLREPGPASDQPSGSLFLRISGWLDGWAVTLGVPPLVVYGIVVILLAAILSWPVYWGWKKVQPVKVFVWDTKLGRKNAFTLSLALGSGVTFNTPPYHLPALGGKEDAAIQIGRSWRGLWIRILDPSIVGEASPYRTTGKLPLKKGRVELMNGEQVFIG